MIKAETIIKGGLKMETVIVVGAVWVSLLVICLWVNYRFHRSYLANNNQEFILESHSSDDEWSRELNLSRG
jgi:hypothetical protein